MGYSTSLHLVDVKIRPKSLRSMKRLLSAKRHRGPLRFFLQHLVINREGFLMLKPSDNYVSEYEPDEDDGTVPALSGKWYEAEDIAAWLKLRARGGRIVFLSEEGDGNAWGWEFDGRDRMRALQLRRVGPWQ